MKFFVIVVVYVFQDYLLVGTSSVHLSLFVIKTNWNSSYSNKASEEGEEEDDAKGADGIERNTMIFASFCDLKFTEK